MSELVQLKLNIETSVGESTPTEAEHGGPLPFEEVGVSRLDDRKAVIIFIMLSVVLLFVISLLPQSSVITAH